VTTKGGRRLGAAYELVDDCRHDVAAWLSWLQERAGPRVGLIGHSLGAVKCLYAAAHEPQLGLGAIVTISPPRLAYRAFCASADGPAFLQMFQRAAQLANAGQPAALLEVTLPLPMAITAAGYVEKYGPHERYDIARFGGSVPCPTLVTFGGQEVERNMAFHGVPDLLVEKDRHSRLGVVTIPGADHFYSQQRAQLLDCLESWLRRPVS
jgi:pimeloyl-ACP methyl ester carboxylesterase